MDTMGSSRDSGGRTGNRISETAMATATMRAFSAHDKRDGYRGPDYLAEIFMPESHRAPLRDPKAWAWVMKDKIAPEMYNYLVARTAFFDESVQNALRASLPQVVFLGAGYDSRPYRFRDCLRGTRLFELDNLAIQQRKIEMLRQADVAAPEQLTYVPIDFTTDDLGDVLSRAGYRTDRQALFVWEGVSYYLAPPVVDGMLRFVSSHAPAGSTICFDYAALSREGLSEESVKRVRAELANKYDEPTRFGIPYGQIEAFLQERGLAIREHLTPAEIESKYLPPRGEELGPRLPALLCFAHAAVP